MKQWLLLLVLLGVAGVPVLAQYGPYPNAPVGKQYPTNLCQYYTQAVCLTAGLQDQYGVALQKYRLDVTNSGGLNTTYYTDDRDTKGWIVVLGVPGLTWGFSGFPGAYGGRVCQYFSPAVISYYAGTAYGSSRYYYESISAGYCS